MKCQRTIANNLKTIAPIGDLFFPGRSNSLLFFIYLCFSFPCKDTETGWPIKGLREGKLSGRGWRRRKGRILEADKAWNQRGTATRSFPVSSDKARPRPLNSSIGGCLCKEKKTQTNETSGPFRYSERGVSLMGVVVWSSFCTTIVLHFKKREDLLVRCLHNIESRCNSRTLTIRQSILPIQRNNTSYQQLRARAQSTNDTDV